MSKDWLHICGHIIDYNSILGVGPLSKYRHRESKEQTFGFFIYLPTKHIWVTDKDDQRAIDAYNNLMEYMDE